MATLTSNNFTLIDGSYTLGDGEDGIGTGTIGGADVFVGKPNLPYGGYTAIGDTYEIYGSGKGGADRFAGGANVGQAASSFEELLYDFGEDGGAFFAGDAQVMYDSALGGNDQAVGGNNSAVVFFGDAYAMYEDSRGGKDTLKGSNALTSTTTSVASSNFLIGDGYYAYGEDGEDAIIGGADIMNGGNATTSGSGGTAGDASSLNALFGDFFMSNPAAHGGNDSLVGGNTSAKGGDAFVANWLVGDSPDLYGSGGADIVKGGSGTLTGNGSALTANLMTGDAMWMADGSTAGNDQLAGGGFTDNNSTAHGDGYVANFMTGDTWEVGGSYGEDGVMMGDDKMTGGSATVGTDGYVLNVMYGDVGDGYWADFFFDEFGGFGEEPQPTFALEFVPVVGEIEYGNDALTGGNGRADNYMIGDAESMGEDGMVETGGNDTITGGGLGSVNYLIGDAYYMGEDAIGGNDRLVSGAGEDMMAGDGVYMDFCAEGGADTFVFKFGNGNDYIEDFRLSDGDKIDITAMRTVIGSFAKLVSQGRIGEDDDGNAVILLGRSSPSMAHDTVTLNGVHPEDVTAAFFNF